MEPLLKRNKANKQYSARLTRWLDRLNHFDLSLKHTAGKEVNFTDFISRNPTENPEAEATSDGKRPKRTDFQPIRRRERNKRNRHA